MLERNPDLKGLLLQATPWVMDARSDTERMQRLALLFDSRRVDAPSGAPLSCSASSTAATADGHG